MFQQVFSAAQVVHFISMGACGEFANEVIYRQKEKLRRRHMSGISTEKYEVFYKDVLIGILTVDVADCKHRYEPNAEGVAKVESTACLIRVMKEGTDGFTEKIPFFENRLYNMKRAGLHEVSYQTDWFLIREIQNESE